MIYIKNSSTDPYFNLAFEEYFLRYVDLDDTIFSLWRSKPSVVVGKHQNTFKEINHKFVSEQNIIFLLHEELQVVGQYIMTLGI